MNYKMILYTLGNILKVTAAFLIPPIIVSLIYQEYNEILSFVIPMIGAFVIGILMSNKYVKPKNTTIYAREGFTIVGISWIVISLIGCLPFIISGTIPSFIDAFFETVSGFTTTGSSILTEIENTFANAHGCLFWRSFTHWIGGMGVLVFVLAFMPNEGETFYIMKAESPGPQVGKLVSKVKLTARILYLLYIALTVLEMIILCIGKMPIFDSIVNSFATAGTGGFGIKNDSIASYNDFCQVTISVFMLLFGVNFNVYYLLILGKFKQAFKSEELRIYLGIVFASVIAITLDVYFTTKAAFGISLKDSFFAVSSIITTTGFSNCDFTLWPQFSQGILLTLMFVGACAGSTGGGIKVSRIAIMTKGVLRDADKLIHPNRVSSIKFEGQKVEEQIVKSIYSFFVIYFIIYFACFLLVSFFNDLVPGGTFDFVTNFTSVAACINNIGPGLGNIVGPVGNFSTFHWASKLVLIFAMLIGRLEIYPITVLLNYKTWTNK